MNDTQAIIPVAYKLESLLRILSLATDGEQIAGKTFEECGGGAVIDMAVDLAGQIITALERADMAKEKGDKNEIARLYATWTAARAASNLRAKDGNLDDEPDPHFEAMMQAEKRLMQIPAKTATDLAMKIYAATSGDVLDQCPAHDPLILEIEALAGKPTNQKVA